MQNSNLRPLSITGDARSRLRQYLVAAGVALSIGLLGHIVSMESTLGVYIMLEALITMVAFLTGSFALIRYYSNRSTLYLYAGLGFIAAGGIDLLRLLVATTGNAGSAMTPNVGFELYLLWTESLSHLFLGSVMFAALWDTRGLYHKIMRDSTRVALYVAGLTFACALAVLVLPIPSNMAWGIVARPVELIPGILWGISFVLLYRSQDWKNDTFVHWLMLALLLASSAATLLYPFCATLTDTQGLLGQIIKLLAFSLVLGGLGNSMFELVRRVESSMLAVQMMNKTLQQEINERRRIERDLRTSQAELADAQQIARMGSWTWDLQTNELSASDGLKRILGISTDHSSVAMAVSMAEAQTLIHPDDLVRVTTIIEHAIEEKTDFETYLRIIRPDGETRILLVRGRTTYDSQGHAVRYWGTGQDLTELVQTEQRLRETAEQLALSNRDLEEFAYITSHDLQEPLRKIMAFCDRVMSKYKDSLDTTGLDYLQRIQQSALRMQTLINDVLALSRVNTGGNPFVPVPLNQVIEGVLGDLETRIEESSAQIRVGPLPAVQGDVVQMRQVFQNLISNALKFCKADLSPVVTIEVVEAHLVVNGTPYCKIVVQDEGIGFDPRYADRIFQPFHRLHSRAKFEGTGMGLSICRRIVERHGGQIQAESELGQGSRFFVTLALEQLIPADKAQSRPATLPKETNVEKQPDAVFSL